MAAFAPSGLRPDFRTSTGFLSSRVSFLHTRMNSLPSPMSSRYITITSVCRCSASISSTSTSLMTALLPMLTTAENPIPCALASSTSAAHMAPLCDTSAILPAFGVTLRNVEFIMVLGSRFITPRQFGPITSMPYFAAISRSCASRRAPSSSTSLKPAVIMTAPPIPFLPHSSSAWATSVLRMTMTARSILPGASSTLLYAFLPKTVSRVGLMGSIFPLKLLIRLLVMVAPTLPGLSDAPITAIERGERNTDATPGPSDFA